MYDLYHTADILGGVIHQAITLEVRESTGEGDIFCSS